MAISDLHRWPIRVYYEDTDLGGVVYYANYLRFLERARTEWARALGLDQARLRDDGVVLVVRRVVADYHLPARFDDELTVTTRVTGGSGARLVLAQAVRRGDILLLDAEVTLAAMSLDGRPRRLPDALRLRIPATGVGDMMPS